MIQVGTLFRTNDCCRKLCSYCATYIAIHLHVQTNDRRLQPNLGTIRPWWPGRLIAHCARLGKYRPVVVNHLVHKKLEHVPALALVINLDTPVHRIWMLEFLVHTMRDKPFQQSADLLGNKNVHMHNSLRRNAIQCKLHCYIWSRTNDSFSASSRT